jgi:VHL beta domain
MKFPFSSWFSTLAIHDPNNVNSFGKIWHGPSARRARSLDSLDESPIRICFRNLTDEQVLLCWIDARGKKHHYYIIDPYTGRKEDINGAINVTARCGISMSENDGDHIEHSQCGHAFLIAQHNDIEGASQRKSLKGATPIGAYSAKRVRPRSWDNVNNEHIIHLVTINDKQREEANGSLMLPDFKIPIHRLRGCCPPTSRRTDRSRGIRIKEEGHICTDESELENDDDDATSRFYLNARAVTCDLTPIDTTSKFYEKVQLGKCKWPAYVETDWFKGNENVKKTVENDLDQAFAYLPKHCRENLSCGKYSTPLWINKSLVFGPKTCPTTGHAMCFHPDECYLIDNGLSKEKCGGVEVYELESYMEDRNLWGTGGSFVHEFAHAYHFKCLKDGFKNQEVLNCYKQAMKEKLYDKVKVHGPQGPTARAYACTDEMEYFAELSAAFLGGIRHQEERKDEQMQDEFNYPASEFNKWFPFNRQQIREHDPRAYEMLKRAWKVEDL